MQFDRQCVVFWSKMVKDSGVVKIQELREWKK